MLHPECHFLLGREPLSTGTMPKNLGFMSLRSQTFLSLQRHGMVSTCRNWSDFAYKQKAEAIMTRSIDQVDAVGAYFKI